MCVSKPRHGCRPWVMSVALRDRLRPLDFRYRPKSDRGRMALQYVAKGHVWTARDWQGLSSRLQHWSEQPCVRPVCAVHMTAGHNALRGSGPGHKRAFEDAVAQVGCPDRQIDRLCITCCSPFPTVTSRRTPDAISSHPKRGGLPVVAALRHQGPRDPRELVSERDGRDLRRPPCQQCH